MSDRSAIEWCDATWGVVLGCDKVSEGCRNCYAIRSSYRAAHLPHTAALYQGLTEKRADGSLNWTGEVVLAYDRLTLPLSWKKPRRVFVNSQSDLFHERVPFGFVANVWQVMAETPQHTYQILTKRPERMRDFVRRWVGGLDWSTPGVLPNVWLGVSVEDQRAADERIPLLLDTPSALRWLSCEPLLGPIDLGRIPYRGDQPYELDVLGWRYRPAGSGHHDTLMSFGLASLGRVDWVVAGGESGPRYRPMDVAWARSLRDQCQAARVPYFFKQHGGRTPKAGGRELDGREWSEFPLP